MAPVLQLSSHQTFPTAVGMDPADDHEPAATLLERINSLKRDRRDFLSPMPIPSSLIKAKSLVKPIAQLPAASPVPVTPVPTATTTTTTTTTTAANPTTTQAPAKAKTEQPPIKLPPIPGPKLEDVLSAFLPSVPSVLLSLFAGQFIYHAIFAPQTSSLTQQGEEVVAILSGMQVANLQVAAKLLPLVVLLVWYMMQQPNVYLMELATFKAPDSWRITYDQSMEILRNTGNYTKDSLDFQEKMLRSSGMCEYIHISLFLSLSLASQ